MIAWPTVHPRSPLPDAPLATGYQRHRAGPATPRPIASGPLVSSPPSPKTIASGAAQCRNATAAPLSAASRAKARSAATNLAPAPRTETGGRLAGSPGGTVRAGGFTPANSIASSTQWVRLRRQTAMYLPNSAGPGATLEVSATIPQRIPSDESRAIARSSGCQVSRIESRPGIVADHRRTSSRPTITGAPGQSRTPAEASLEASMPDHPESPLARDADRSASRSPARWSWATRRPAIASVATAAPVPRRC